MHDPQLGKAQEQLCFLSYEYVYNLIPISQRYFPTLILKALFALEMKIEI